MSKVTEQKENKQKWHNGQIVQTQNVYWAPLLALFTNVVAPVSSFLPRFHCYALMRVSQQDPFVQWKISALQMFSMEFRQGKFRITKHVINYICFLIA